MTGAAGDVWVNGYTTSAGVDVSGHWRSRRPAAAAGEDPPAGPPPAAAPLPELTGLAALEERYRHATLAAAIATLRYRRGQVDAAAAGAALAERADAKAEFDAARARLGQAAPPPEPPAAPVQSAPPAATAAVRDRCASCGQYRAEGHACPAPAGLPEGSYSGMKGEERVKAMVADLESSVRAIVESGQLRRWLDAMASNGMTRWSANNRLLAAVQLLQRGESLEDIHVMGFQQWKRHNRHVVKGAKAVWILTPRVRKEKDPDGAEHERLVGFGASPVFNIGDTEGDPMPGPLVRPAPGEATPGTLEGLRSRVEAAGYAYEEAEIPGCRPDTGQGTLGFTEPGTKRIVVDSRLSPAQKAATIAHELGHVHCGHVDGDFAEYRRHRGQMETEAEMTGYLVSRARGMTRDQVDAFSPGYIAGWSKGDPAVVHKAVDKATKAFNRIIDGEWPG